MEPTLATSKLIDQPASLTGFLRTVDPNGALGYLPLDDPLSQVSPTGLLANTATQITIDGKSAKIADLKPGMDIIFLDPGDKPLDKLEAFSLFPDNKAHTKQGPIDKISDTSITFLAGRKDLFPCTVTLSTETTVTLDGNPAKSTDLKYRMLLNVTYQGTVAQSIAASTVIMDNAQHHADGILVSAAADLIDIRLYGNPGFDVKLKPAEPFKIQKESGRGNNVTLADAALADLQKGQHVVATYVNGSASDITIKAGGGAAPANRRPAAGAPARTPNSQLP